MVIILDKSGCVTKSRLWCNSFKSEKLAIFLISQVEHWTEVNFGEELLGGYIDGIDKFAADMNFALENPDDGMYSDRATRFVSALEITYKLVEEVGRFDREDRDIMLNYTQTLLDLAVPVSELLNELMDPAKWTDVLRACGSQCDQMQFLLSTIELNLDQISSPDVIRNIIISNEEFATLDRMLEIVQEMDVNMHELADGFIYANEDKFTNLLDQLDAFFRDGSDTFKAVINNLVFSKNELGEDTEELTELFFKIAYYTFLVPSIVLVFVLFFYICGFVMGLCAPIGSDLRLNGARMIYAGTILFLTFSLLMWLLTTLLFVSGSALDKLYCDTVENPADAELYNVLEDDLNELLRNVFNNSDMSHVSWSVPEMLEQCQDDKSLYMILKLNESYDVRQLLEWRSHLDTESTLTTLTSLFNLRASQIAPLIQIDETTDPTLREDMLAIQDKLTPLVDDFLYDFYDGEEQISFDNVIRVDSFQALYDSLVHLGAVDTDDEAFADGLEDLTDLAGQLNSLIPAFRSLFEETTEYAFSYYQRIHMETAGGYIYKNIGTLVSETQPNGYLYETPRAILDNIDIMLEELTTDYTDLLELFDWFADYSVTLFEQELGSCEPMYEVYEAGVHYSCHDVVDALNCMWSGLGIVLVCSIPLLVCAVKVEGAYRTLRGDEEVADAPVNIFRESMTKISLGNDSLNSGAGQRIPSIKLIAEQGQS